MIAVTGATGNVGRALVQALAAGGEQVMAVSRRPSDARAPEGVRRWQADLAEPESLRPVLDGADALFLLVAGENPQGILDVAKAGGVQRVVLLSSQGAASRPEMYRHPRVFEDAVGQSGLDSTILRPGGFFSNAFLWAQLVRSQRTVAAPFGDIGLPLIDPADIAEAAAVVLRDGSHAGRTYELTGPGLITPREQAQVLGAALGTPVRFLEHSRDDARSHMLQFMPEPVVQATLTVLGEPSDAEQRVSPHVEQILGHPPRTFAEWAARNIAAFR